MTRMLFSCPSLPLFPQFLFRTIVIRFLSLLFFILIFLSARAQHGSMLRFDGVDDYVELGNLLPNGSYTKECWISAGFFVFQRRVLDYLSGDDCILEREPLERLAREGQLKAFRHDGFYYAMDTFREYQQLNALWNVGKAPWKIWE